MTVVIDVGCFPHGHEVSVERLIARYQPRTLLGFDPYPDLEERTYTENGTTVTLRRAAAWTRDGEIQLAVVRGERGWDSTVVPEKNSRREWDGEVVTVPCVDLAAVVTERAGHGLVVKLDCEGAEYTLIEHLIATGTDRLVDLLLVEWHDAKMADPQRYSRWRQRLVKRACRCPVEDWVL